MAYQMQFGPVLARSHELVDVAARAEHCSLAGEHYHPRRAAFLNRGERIIQRSDEGS